MTYYVYTLRDASAKPVYIGVTTDPTRRMKEHSTNIWWLNVDQSQTTISEYADAETARSVEESLIALHKPEHNRAGVIGPYIPYRPAASRGPSPVYEEAADAETLQLHVRNVERKQQELNAATEARDEMIREVLRRGASPTKLAKLLGISRERVYQIRDKRR